MQPMMGSIDLVHMNIYKHTNIHACTYKTYTSCMGQARPGPGPCKMCMFPMCMYSFSVYIHVYQVYGANGLH